MIPAPEGKGVEQAEGNEPGGRLGTAGCMGVGVEGDMFTKCLPLPSYQVVSWSELHPVPPSFPWKHGSKGKGYNSSQIYPHPLQRKVWKYGPSYILQKWD